MRRYLTAATVTLLALLLAAAAQAAGPAPLFNQIASYLKQRPGTTTVAVYDLHTGRSWFFAPWVRNETASIVKVDILETRLHQTAGHLSGTELGLARQMIEFSDNNAATDLWNRDGGPGGVGAYNRELGLRCTTPASAWGLTQTCAGDQVRLLATLATHNSLLSDSSRAYQLDLMEHVTPSQAWGVSGGVPRSAGVSVALKNGWLPFDSVPWVVNSVGMVSGQGRRYLIAVLTRDPSEGDGIDTIQGVSAIVYRRLDPALRRPPAPPKRKPRPKRRHGK